MTLDVYSSNCDDSVLDACVVTFDARFDAVDVRFDSRLDCNAFMVLFVISTDFRLIRSVPDAAASLTAVLI